MWGLARMAAVLVRPASLAHSGSSRMKLLLLMAQESQSVSPERVVPSGLKAEALIRSPAQGQHPVLSGGFSCLTLQHLQSFSGSDGGAGFCLVPGVRMMEVCPPTPTLQYQVFLSKVKEAFQCICCQELVFRPVTTVCQHNVCKVRRRAGGLGRWPEPLTACTLGVHDCCLSLILCRDPRLPYTHPIWAITRD